jgi:hypothetical protein
MYFASILLSVIALGRGTHGRDTRTYLGWVGMGFLGCFLPCLFVAAVSVVLHRCSVAASQRQQQWLAHHEIALCFSLLLFFPAASRLARGFSRTWPCKSMVRREPPLNCRVLLIPSLPMQVFCATSFCAMLHCSRHPCRLQDETSAQHGRRPPSVSALQRRLRHRLSSPY